MCSYRLSPLGGAKNNETPNPREKQNINKGISQHRSIERYLRVFSGNEPPRDVKPEVQYLDSRGRVSKETDWDGNVFLCWERVWRAHSDPLGLLGRTGVSARRS